MTVSRSLEPVIDILTVKIQQLFDLDVNISDVNRVLGSLSEDNPGIRVVGCIDGFEIAVRAILGQQITVAAAITLTSRLVNLVNYSIATECNISLIFPTAQRILLLSQDDMGSLGIIKTRVNAIQLLATEIVEGRLCLDPQSSISNTYNELLLLPGVGPWTANYILMRALKYSDAFLESDVGIKKALFLKSPKEISIISKQWSPWRSYSMMHLWRKNAN